VENQAAGALAAARLRRPLSALELAVGAAIVVGHNVYRVVPNEVVILFVLGLVSYRLRDGGWSGLGFQRPPSWPRVIAIALGAVVLRLGTGALIEWALRDVWPPVAAPSGADAITGSLRTALLVLLLVWTFAAFGEEIAYRGYLMGRAADVGGGTPAAWWTAMVLAAVLFGIGHFYKGPTGIIDSGVAGLILGAAYLASGRILWTSVLAHGLIDTVGVVALYFAYDI
jgi:uncharacterized protein